MNKPTSATNIWCGQYCCSSWRIVILFFFIYKNWIYKKNNIYVWAICVSVFKFLILPKTRITNCSRIAKFVCIVFCLVCVIKSLPILRESFPKKKIIIIKNRKKEKNTPKNCHCMCMCKLCMYLKIQSSVFDSASKQNKKTKKLRTSTVRRKSTL